MNKPLLVIFVLVVVAAAGLKWAEYSEPEITRHPELPIGTSHTDTSPANIGDDEVVLLTGDKYLGKLIRRTQDAIVFKPVTVGTIDPVYTFKYSEIDDITLDRNIIGQQPDHTLLKSFYEIENFKEDIYALYLKGDFQALEQKIANFRDNKLRFASGEWKLDAFYKAIKDKHDDQSIDVLEAAIAKLNTWKETYPDSITPIVLLIHTYVDLAWEHRGSSKGKAVSKEGWKNFRKNIQLAAEIIAQTDEALASTDPRFYVASTSISLGLGSMKETLLHFLDKTTRYDPAYYDIHLVNSAYLLPRWTGSVGDIEKYSDEVVKVTNDISNYARIAERVHRYTGRKGYNKFEFSWDKIQAGFESILDKYPTNFYQLHAYAQMACYYNKYDIVKAISSKTGDLWNSEAKKIWGSVASYYECMALANSDNPIKINLNTEIRKGNYHRFVELVKSGIELNKKNPDGNTPLHFALKSRFPDYALVLINAGADLRTTDSARAEPIHVAAKEGYASIVSKMLEKGVPVNVQSQEYLWSPLHYASKYNQLRVLRVLLAQANIDINARTNYNETALHNATRLGDYKSVFLLLAKPGIELSIANNQRLTPLDIAKQYNYKKIALLLRTRGAKSDPNAITDEKKRIADLFFKDAFEAHNKNDLGKAKGLYMESIEVNPYSTGPYVNLALINIFENDYSACVKNTLKAIELDKDNAHAILSTGQCLFMLNKHKKEFLAYYKRYIELRPDSHRSKQLLRRHPELNNK